MIAENRFNHPGKRLNKKRMIRKSHSSEIPLKKGGGLQRRSPLGWGCRPLYCFQAESE
jgi:hypothetical protein